MAICLFIFSAGHLFDMMFPVCCYSGWDKIAFAVILCHNARVSAQKVCLCQTQNFLKKQ